MFLQPDAAMGHVITMKTTRPEHINEYGFKTDSEKGVEKSFGDVLLSAFNDVNDLQIKTNKLSEQMITDPESVDVHDVMIALAEANLSLSMTKAIVDRGIRAYKEIISVR